MDNHRTLGNSGLRVAPIGLGCMGMSFAYGGADDATSLRVLHRAVELGVTLIDTAEVYGPYANEDLVGRALKELRGKVHIATKFGFKILPHGQGVERMAGVDSRPEHVVRAVEASLSRLGIECIDLLYQHRVDPAVPIEDVVGAMADLVRAGKVRHLGLSEVSAATLRRAHAVHPIAAVQSEYSLWSRDVEADVLPACRELGVGFVPYSPLGRGFLTGQLTSGAALAPDDYRHSLPRFQPPAMAANAHLVAELQRLAAARGATAAQLALAWLLAQGTDIVPIPGARSLVHLEENVAAAQITLSDAELAAIGAAIAPASVQGARYPDVELAMVGL
ncbi:General stress protein 69 [Janthinobacterium sp. KBS0711]|uniref:aldo/keto reductase n=1 Tax=Janthinobacterium sp. KBS0711 TaxID=1649647 RepID=UPI0006281631|nr:aldo/keto reductase [Janthinobacterium sp. KBS0711]KKO61888.1 General stress protein 69 [Janthinobacterium sp. KBS0711]TSD71909.1 aldo/keto reductase [Janthinobacterium sp. KBS0711]